MIGRYVAQCRVQSTLVVEPHDVIADVLYRFTLVGVILPSGALHFQVQEEALHHRVPAITPAAHAAPHIVARQQRLIGRAGVLTAPVRVGDQARLRLPLSDGQLHGADHQFGPHMSRHSQPTMLRENRSMTAARYTQPLRVRI